MIAIHSLENSFTKRWIEYCQANNVDFMNVNIYDTNIVKNLKENNVTVLLTNPPQFDYRTNLISSAILLSVEMAGIKVFPDFKTYWHFDDKIAQKYVFESLDIPTASMHVFYDKIEANNWLDKTEFPLVFKLRGGAGSSNVFLLRNRKEASRYLNRMFAKGLKPVRSVFNDFKNKMHRHADKKDWVATFRRFFSTQKNIFIANSRIPREKGYFLVQDFLPGNDFDTRVTVIGEKAIAFRRFNRPNDFKASGSGRIEYSSDEIDRNAVALAFESIKKLGAQSMAFDIIYTTDGKPVILEMSYSYLSEPVYKAGGYWDSSLIFHNDPIWPEAAIIELVLGLKN